MLRSRLVVIAENGFAFRADTINWWYYGALVLPRLEGSEYVTAAVIYFIPSFLETGLN